MNGACIAKVPSHLALFPLIEHGVARSSRFTVTALLAIPSPKALACCDEHKGDAGCWVMPVHATWQSRDSGDTQDSPCLHHIVLHVVMAVVAFCALHAREQTVDPTPCHRQRTRLDVSFSHRTVAVINTTCRSLARSP